MRSLTVSEAPLMGIFGSETAYRVLLFLENYGQGYAAEIARTFEISLTAVLAQLSKFEESGLLVSQEVGTARIYSFNRNPITDELRVFLRSILELLPESTLEKYYRQRRRPRRAGKR